MLRSAGDDAQTGNIDKKLVTEQKNCTDIKQDIAATAGIVPSRPGVKKPDDGQVRKHRVRMTQATVNTTHRHNVNL